MYDKSVFIKSLIYTAVRLFPAAALICALSVILVLSADETERKKNEGGRNNILKMSVVAYSDTPISEDGLRGIKDGLKENGYIQDRDYTLREFNAQGDSGTLNSIIDAAANSGYDLIFTISTPSLQAALKKIKKTPIVFSSTGDPIGAGAGKNFNEHVENATGICSISDFTGMVKLVKKISPGVKKIGTVFCPAEINSVLYKDHLKEAAAAEGITLEAAAANTAVEVVDAANSLCSGRGVEIICQIADNLSASSFSAIIKSAAGANIPVFGFIESNAKNGAVLSYSKDYYQGGIDSARLAVRIIKGEKPAGIPFEYISKTTLVINKKAAAAAGVNIAETVLRSADLIIE
jgi:ABC-type uncharacterized transport system substrate-binding protein